MSTSYVMRVSRNGQVSIPADARARWNADRVVVVDLGDRIVMRPLSEDAAGELVGKYRHEPRTDDARRVARANDAAAEKRKRR
jgi:bifunctional DNA-binding transcriptional regulator/antitoxin component of YhaV-PrlF toxin-antitoxin module